ncbi:hypothetical protein GCM10010341_51050 [Streptomyces noursei]|nr:hypothetical protein GCM10010341_51050 [Streptomyces noursei]
MLPQLVPGHEGSGAVTAAGPGDTGLAEGDRAVLSWSASPASQVHGRLGIGQPPPQGGSDPTALAFAIGGPCVCL